VEWIGAASQRLAARTDLIKKVCISLSASITADAVYKAWSTISVGDWNLSYEFLTSTWMKDIIQELSADDEWVYANGHERGIEMQPEEREFLDFNDDTALNCIELGQALDNIDEGNIVTPIVDKSRDTEPPHSIICLDSDPELD